MENTANQLVLGPLYVLCTVLGVSVSFFMIIHTAQKKFCRRNLVMMACAFSNLLGFVISPSLVAASLLVNYPISSSLRPFEIGDLGFTVGFIFFSLVFSLFSLKTRQKEVILVHVGVLSVALLDTATLLPALDTHVAIVRAIHLVAMATALAFLCFNMGVCFITTKRVGPLGDPGKSADGPVVMTEAEHFNRQCLMMSFVLISLCFLPKITYDAFDTVTCPEDRPGLHGYFETRTYLMTRTLMYVSAFVQSFCCVKLM